ncbi:MAG TPA: hypothetical protein VM597_20600 [Gemmataceae bacterium]|nr:hypothetical protein [Gemmataceae bacterium]
MSILGKVLIFLNLLAAGAFTYLTIQDWKARQELQWARFRGDLVVTGLPVQPADVPPKVDDDQVVFPVTAAGRQYESIPRDRLKDLLPNGDDVFGGEPVATQTAEVDRVKKKVLDSIPPIAANAGQDRLRDLTRYLMNLARTGAERDGVRALLDVLYDATKRGTARRDLAFLARTASQVEAYKAMIEVLALNDLPPETDDSARAGAVAKARDAVKRFAMGETAHAGGDAAEVGRQMANLYQGGGKEAVANAAQTPEFKQFVVEAAANPLTGKANVDAAADALAAYAESKARKDVPAEAAALKDLTALMKVPVATAVTAAQVDAAATNLLTAHFEDAAAPAGKGDETAGGKARKIAHLLYHLDAHRHLDPAAAAARQAWHTRVAWVVGLQLYVQVAEAQASEYAEAAERQIALITDEETAFRGQYDELIQRARLANSRYEALLTESQTQAAITAENERLMKERLTERDNLLKELKESQDKAKAALDKLLETQGRLFTIQRDLRNAQEAILALEKELRRRELGGE